MDTEKDDGVFCSTFCNSGHSIKTGRPIGHQCRVIPPKALALERAGDFDGAIEIISARELVRHNGAPTRRRRRKA